MASAFCFPSSTIAANGPILFLSFIQFGSSINMQNANTNGSYLLQPGTYLVHLSAEGIQSSGSFGRVEMFLNGTKDPGFAAGGIAGSFPSTIAETGLWQITQGDSISGDLPLLITTANSTLKFVNTDTSPLTLGATCRLVITQLQ